MADVSNSDVSTKYQEASKIRVDQTGKLYKKNISVIAVEKGVAFPRLYLYQRST